MIEMFRLGGFGMIPTFLFGVLAVVASARFAFRPERRHVPLQVSLSTLTLAAGGLGFVTGLIKSLLAMGEVGPDERWMWLLGAGEALHNLALALALLTLGGLAASVGALRLARQEQAG
jgi:hypothetical protein